MEVKWVEILCRVWVGDLGEEWRKKMDFDYNDGCVDVGGDVLFKFVLIGYVGKFKVVNLLFVFWELLLSNFLDFVFVRYILKIFILKNLVVKILCNFCME